MRASPRARRDKLKWVRAPLAVLFHASPRAWRDKLKWVRAPLAVLFHHHAALCALSRPDFAGIPFGTTSTKSYGVSWAYRLDIKLPRVWCWNHTSTSMCDRSAEGHSRSAPWETMKYLRHIESPSGHRCAIGDGRERKAIRTPRPQLLASRRGGWEPDAGARPAGGSITGCVEVCKCPSSRGGAARGSTHGQPSHHCANKLKIRGRGPNSAEVQRLGLLRILRPAQAEFRAFRTVIWKGCRFLLGPARRGGGGPENFWKSPTSEHPGR